MRKNCFAYIRVSTVKQGEGVSLEAQKEAIESFAERNDLNIARWFEEKETAAKKGRPLFETMVRDLHRGKAQGLVVHKIDRSARNFADWAKIGELSDSGIDIHFATESLDFRSRGGRLTADIQAVIAADYIRNLREETVKGLNGRLKQGIYPFKAPIGYLDNGGGKLKTIDPKLGPIVRETFELYATGEHSIRSLVREMPRRGLLSSNGKPLTKTGIAKVLGNPFYTGVIEIRRTGKVYSGRHEPLISTSLFKAVQDRKAGRYRKKVTKHKFTYRTVFHCHSCGRSMIPERQKGHAYYRCHVPECPTNAIRETEIEKQIEDHLSALAIDPALVEDFKKRLRQGIMEMGKPAFGNIAHVQLARIDAQIERLSGALGRGVLDDETYQNERKRLLIDQAKIKQGQSQTSRKRTNEQTLERFLELAEDLCQTYIFALPSEKRQIVEMAFSNRTVFDKKLYIEPRKWVSDALNLPLVLYSTQVDPNARSGVDVPESAIAREIGEYLGSLDCAQLEKMIDVLHRSLERHRCVELGN